MIRQCRCNAVTSAVEGVVKANNTGYNTGDLSGTFDGLADGATFSEAGGLWQIDYDDTAAGLIGGTGTNYVTITAIPESSAALLGAFGMLALLRRRRR